MLRFLRTISPKIYVIAGAALVAVIVAVIILVSVLGRSPSLGSVLGVTEFIQVASVENGGSNYEIIVSEESDKIYILKDGEVTYQESRNIRYLDYEQSIMEVNENAEPRDITAETPLFKDTWKLGANEASCHVEYLKESGYRVVTKASTGGFIELVFKKSGQQGFIRMVITNEATAVSSISEYTFDIKQYIS